MRQCGLLPGRGCLRLAVPKSEAWGPRPFGAVNSRSAGLAYAEFVGATAPPAEQIGHDWSTSCMSLPIADAITHNAGPTAEGICCHSAPSGGRIL